MKNQRDIEIFEMDLNHGYKQFIHGINVFVEMNKRDKYQYKFNYDVTYVNKETHQPMY